MTGEPLFLSYARPDSVSAQRLHSALEAHRFVVRWDRAQAPGFDWTEQIFRWIEEADAVILLVTRHSAVSLSVKNEVLVAFDLQRLVVPVVEHSAPGGLWLLIRALQWVDARGGRDPMPDLLAQLRGDRGDHPRRPDPPPPGAGPSGGLPWPEPPGDSPRRPASEARVQITIELQGRAQDFLEREREALRALLARFAKITAEEIRILRVEEGSVRVTLELPEQTASWLVALHRRGDPLVQFLDILAVQQPQRLGSGGNARRTSAQADRRWRPGAWRNLLTPALGLATALALAWGLTQQARVAGLEEQIAQQQTQASRNRQVAVDVFGNEDALEGRIEGTAAAPEASGQIWLSPSGPAVAFYAKGLPPPPEGRRYQLWLEQDGRIVSVGPITVDEAGRSWDLLQPPQLPPDPQRAFVTAEPASGSQQPTGEEVLRASLEPRD